MRLALVSVMFVACNSGKKLSSIDAMAPPTEVSVVDAGPTSRVDHASSAIFEGDDLHQCVDVETTLPEGVDAGIDAPKDANLARLFLEKELKNDGPKLTPIGKSCAEQFTDRKALANCSVSERGLVLREWYYDFADVGMSDSEMKDCFEHQGDWKAVPRDSPAWRSAKLDHDTKAARKLIGR